MEEKKNIITFTCDGENVELEVVEQTTISGNNYLLVCDAKAAEEGDAFILKEINNNEGDVIYDEVVDGVELNAVAKVFGELIDEGIDLQFD